MDFKALLGRFKKQPKKELTFDDAVKLAGDELYSIAYESELYGSESYMVESQTKELDDVLDKISKRFNFDRTLLGIKATDRKAFLQESTDIENQVDYAACATLRSYLI